jgi:hypothetical protein
MLGELTKKELRQQLKLNGIAFGTKSTEDELRELLKVAIDEGKAELQAPKDSSVSDKSVVQEEKQVDLMACIRQNMGLPPFADKWEK